MRYAGGHISLLVGKDPNGAYEYDLLVLPKGEVTYLYRITVTRGGLHLEGTARNGRKIEHDFETKRAAWKGAFAHARRVLSIYVETEGYTDFIKLAGGQ